MAMEHLNELANEVRDLQESASDQVAAEKVRALASLALELARAVQDLHDRLNLLEAKQRG